MASPAAILAASRAARIAKASGGPGGPRQTPPPQGYMPSIGGLPQYSAVPGNPYEPGYGPFLPRPSETFTAGAFAPFSPILPAPVDQPPPGAERPQPRRRQYEAGVNLPTGMPGNEGYKLAGFPALKSLSDLYSILRRCLQIRKSEIRALDWDIVLTKDAAKAYRGDKAAMRDFGERRAKAMRFFRRPDPNYFTFSSWLDAMLDQVFVYDALSLYMAPKRGRGMGKGLLGSDLDSLWVLDGSTIRPLTGMHGEYPAPPAPAFQQILFGVPRADFSMMVDGRDLAESGLSDNDVHRELRGDQLLYLPFLQRPDSPYGFSLTEMCLIPVMTGLQKQAYQLSFFDESSVPRCYVSPGDVNMTPNQIRELQLALNAVAGDTGNFFKVTVLPPGSKVMPQKEMQIVDQADEWIANEVAMTCGVRPTEIGVIPQVSTVASPFAAREMAQSSRAMHERTDTKPTLKFITEIFDTILQVVCHQEDMRFLFSGMEESADLAAATDMGIKQIQSGVTSIDEFRDKLGLTPWGFPETQGPIVFTPMGPIPLFEGVQNALAAQAEQRGQQQGALTGAHAAAEGATGTKSPPKAITSGANPSGRPGSVTERQASRGGALAPQHATGTGAPGTATGKAAEPDITPGPPRSDLGTNENVNGVAKAAQAELEALTRHLKKGRHVSTWEPRHIPGAVMAMIAEDLTKGLTPDQVATIAAPVLALKAATAPQQPSQAQQQQLTAQYTAAVAAAFAAAITAAAALIAAWIAGTLAVTTVVLAQMIAGEIRKHLMGTLTALWTDAWNAGAQSVAGETGTSAAAASAEALAAFLATEGVNWADLIAGTGQRALIQAIRDALAAGDPEAVVAALAALLRVDQRAGTIAGNEVMRAWNAAAMEVYKRAGVTFVSWVTTSGDPCPTCIANQKASPKQLGELFPGGLPGPLQHVNCRCYLKPVPPPRPAGAAVTAAKVLRRQVDTNGQEFYGDAPPLEANPAGGGATGPYPHRADGTYQQDIPGGVPGATAGGEPPRWDGSGVRPVVEHAPDADDSAAYGGAAGTGSVPQSAFPAPYMDSYWPGGGHGHGTDQAPTSSPGGTERGRPPNPVGKAAADAAKFLATAPKAKPGAVFRQMRGNYPAGSIAWIKDGMKWAGPSEVPLAFVDFSRQKEWAAHHQQDKVDHFARELRAGRHVDPVVAVTKPGRRRIRVIDGHHRALACKRLGIPVRAYVGFLGGDSKSADETHLYQVHQGDSPQNKSFTAGNLGLPGAVYGNTPFNLAGTPSLPVAAGLAVRAEDTGRVLMLQRAVTDDDPAAGKWEFPGGRLETSETPLLAATREWSEETGCALPRGSLSGHWASPDGGYEGFVLSVPLEAQVPVRDGRDQVINPDDPDGDQEAVAWWDPADLRDDPAVRPELLADLDVVLEALGAGNAEKLDVVLAALGGGAKKSARTPMLEVTPRILGPEGLWHTPDRHVGGKQKLPDYVEQIAGALMDQQGMGESEAIATAINAIKRWAAGDLHWGHYKITPEVIAASQDALRQWDDLKASHH